MNVPPPNKCTPLKLETIFIVQNKSKRDTTPISFILPISTDQRLQIRSLFQTLLGRGKKLLFGFVQPKQPNWLNCKEQIRPSLAPRKENLSIFATNFATDNFLRLKRLKIKSKHVVQEVIVFSYFKGNYYFMMILLMEISVFINKKFLFLINVTKLIFVIKK